MGLVFSRWSVLSLYPDTCTSIGRVWNCTSILALFLGYVHGRTRCNTSCTFLGAFAKSRKAIVSFVTSVHSSVSVSLSVHLSVRPSAWNNSAPTERIFKKFYISICFRKSVEKIQVSSKTDKNNGYFTRRRFHVCDSIPRNSS